MVRVLYGRGDGLNCVYVKRLVFGWFFGGVFLVKLF